MIICTCPCRVMGARSMHGCTGQRDEYPKIECFPREAGETRIPIYPCTPCRLANLRMLITGPREFPSEFHQAVIDTLVEEVHALAEYEVAPIVVQGGARGVDKIAREWARSNGFMVETHYPDYQQYGRTRAPHVRNATMVNLGAHVVVGFLLGDPKTGGTVTTLEKAEKAGLRVHRHSWGALTPQQA